ncbi:MAG: transporter substrate-binding domain-containing protein [Bacteroidales bacterium]|nr:transporter substrate-binding domain-containing protein [Bacteroidales bacterium]
MRAKANYILFVLTLLFSQCSRTDIQHKPENGLSRIETIKENGVLKVVTDYNTTSYFIYRGQPMGFQFELLQNLADYLQVKLEVVANNSLDEKFDMLGKGEIDLIAVNLTVTKERREFLEFIEPHSQTRQVLVQRKPENWQRMGKNELEAKLLTKHVELGGKTIYIQKNSSYEKRLFNLSDEIGDTIHVKITDDGVEQLIEKVASGQIDYTVCDENIAIVNQSYYSNIDVSLPVSFPQNLAWAVAKGDMGLKAVVDEWLVEFKKTTKYAIIYNKYFRNSRSSTIAGSEYFTISTGNISPYDQYIKEFSSQINWDWRLVASMMYQESRFNENARSWAGAFGLMQMMPGTAERFGVDSASSAKAQIRAGIMFIQWLEKLFQEIPDPIERQKFVLASYNVGPGHVIDARNLASKNGKNPNIWTDNVDIYLLKKAEPEYYNDPVVKYGYCRGIETFKYVTDVVDRYEHYKNLVE